MIILHNNSVSSQKNLGTIYMYNFFSKFIYCLAFILSVHHSTAFTEEYIAKRKIENSKLSLVKSHLSEQFVFEKLYIHAKKGDVVLWVPYPKEFKIDYQKYGIFTFIKIPYILLIAPFLILFIFNYFLRKKHENLRLLDSVTEHPPENLTPAEMSYLYYMGYRTEAFVSMLVDLHMKGSIHISRRDDRSYIISKTYSDVNKLSRIEAKLLMDLFAASDIIIIDEHSSLKLKTIISSFGQDIASNYKPYFTNCRVKKALFEVSILAVFIPVIISSEILLPFFSIYLMASFFYLGLSRYLSRHRWAYPKKNAEDLYKQIASFRLFLIILKERPNDILLSPLYNISEKYFRDYLPYMVALNVVNDWDMDFADTLKGDLSREELPSLLSLGLNFEGVGFKRVFTYRNSFPLNPFKSH